MSKSVIVCGGGVIGLACAEALARAGHGVTVLERGLEGHDSCASGSAGMIVPSHFVPLAAPGMVWLGLKWMLNDKSPFYVRPRLDRELWRWGWLFWRAANATHVARCSPLLCDLNLHSRELFLALAAATGNELQLETKGLLMLCKTQQALAHEAVTALRAQELGLEVRILDARAAQALEPGVRMDVAGAIHFPQDCHLAPQALLRVLARRAQEAGVRFLFGSEASGWRVEGARIAAVRTGGAELAADEFVLASGAWSPALLAPLGLRLPMQAGKGYSLTLQGPPRLPRSGAIFTEARIAVTPLGSALRFGGTMELSGLDQGVRRARVEQIIASVPRYYPEFGPEHFAGVQPWHGFRPCSPDGMPYVGRFRRHPNLIAATGHAMLGLSLAPVTGQLIAELVSGQKPSHPLDALSPDRYA